VGGHPGGGHRGLGPGALRPRCHGRLGRPRAEQRGQQDHLLLGALHIRQGQAQGRPGRTRPGVRPACAATGQPPGYAGNSRLPEEAKYLASLPPAKAIAVRLDTRADRERARLAQAQATPPQPAPADPVTARWAWPSVAAVVLPLLALLIILLA
jgi:hypothetical protein